MLNKTLLARPRWCFSTIVFQKKQIFIISPHRRGSVVHWFCSTVATQQLWRLRLADTRGHTVVCVEFNLNRKRSNPQSTPRTKEGRRRCVYPPLTPCHCFPSSDAEQKQPAARRAVQLLPGAAAADQRLHHHLLPDGARQVRLPAQFLAVAVQDLQPHQQQLRRVSQAAPPLPLPASPTSTTTVSREMSDITGPTFSAWLGFVSLRALLELSTRRVWVGLFFRRDVAVSTQSFLWKSSAGRLLFFSFFFQAADPVVVTRAPDGT